MEKKSFLRGAAVLGVAGIIVKILGAIYRIPLTNIIGSEGIGHYQTSYPLYNLLTVISTAGLPVAMAKLISEKRTHEDYIGAQKVFKASCMAFFMCGLLTALGVFVWADKIAIMLGNPDAVYSLLALVPALIIVPMMSSFRGYYQGRQNMVPMGISQVVEQAIRMITGLSITYLLLDHGLPKAAGGAASGASFGALAGLLVMILIYAKDRKIRKEELNKSKKLKDEKYFEIIKTIFKTAIPITISFAIIPLMNTIDVSIVMNRLKDIGYSQAEATSLYGQLTGMAQNFINFPQVFSIGIAMSIVPAIASANALRDYEEVRKISKSGMRTALMIGIPSALGLFILSRPIISLLYFNTPWETQTSAGSILGVLAFSIMFLAFMQALTAILQGIGRADVPVKAILVGAVFKLILTYVLTGVESININGAAIGTICAYMVASTIDLYAVIKYIKIEFSLKDIILKPLLSGLIMMIAAHISFNLIASYVPEKLATLLAVIIAGVVYVLALLLTNSITDEDLMLLPKGQKIASLLKKIKFK